MVNVPEYRRQVRDRPVNQVGARVSTSPDTFGAGIGRATQTLASGVADAADAIDFRHQLTEDAVGREAYDAYRRAHREALNAPEEGYLNRTGANGIGVQEPAERDLRKLQEQYGKGLNPRARKKYDQLVGEMQDQAHGQLLNHTSNQTRNFIENERRSTIEGYLEEAATNWGDQELFDRNVGLALAEQEELATLQGWDGATREQAAEKLISGAMKQRIVQAAAQDPLAAKDMLENAREVLNAADEYALDTNLKELVIQAQADAVVNEHIVRGGVVGSAVDPYEAALGGAESGNNPNAANNPNNPGYASPDGRYSSALGTRQYLRGTYLEAVRAMQSEGGAAWAKGMTDDEIARTRTDPKIEGSVHSYVRAQNQGALRTAGLPVTPTNEYAMHHFGAGGGKALITGARNNPAAPVSTILSPAVMKANPQFKNLTVGQAYDWVSNHLGADGSTANGQAFFDASAAYRAALAIEDPEVRDAALAKINSLSVMQERARGLSQQEAQEEAWNTYAETGQSDFGVETMQAMGQAGWTAFQSAVARDRQGIDETDPATWDMLTTAASNTREFAEINLEAHRGNLSKADWRAFYEQREAARAAVGNAPFELARTKQNIDYAKMYTYADDLYKGIVTDKSEADLSQEERMKRVEFQRTLSTLIGEFFDRETREPTQLEVQDMALGLLLPVEVDGGGWFGGTTRLFEMQGREDGQTFDVVVAYDDIPYQDRGRIASMLTAEGIEPTREAVENAYEREAMLKAGMIPLIGAADVPKDFATSVTDVMGTLSEAELVEMYQLYLLESFREQE